MPRATLASVARRFREFPLLNTPHAFAGALQDTLAVALLVAWTGEAAAGCTVCKLFIPRSFSVLQKTHHFGDLGRSDQGRRMAHAGKLHQPRLRTALGQDTTAHVGVESYIVDRGKVTFTVGKVTATAAGTSNTDTAYATAQTTATVTDADGQTVAETGSRRGRVSGTFFHLIAEDQ